MKIFLAAGDSLADQFPDKKLLIAYPFIKKKSISPLPHWFVDSGAYSVFTGKAKFTLPDIIEDYKIYQATGCDTLAGLDVIGSDEKTLQNCLEMKATGLNIMPTFHINDNMKYLHYYCQNFSYIALGGVAHLKHKPELLIKWLDECWRIIGQYDRIKVHGFAITNFNLLKRYPFHSVDSTTWMKAASVGEMILFEDGITKRVHYSDLHHQKKYNFIRMADSEGIKNNTNRILYNIKTIERVEQYITKLWEIRGIKWN